MEDIQANNSRNLFEFENSSNSTSPGDNGLQDWFLFTCGILAILANILVLSIAYTSVDLEQRLNQIFVLSMTVADLVFSLVYLVSKPVLDYVPIPLCGPYYILLWTCQVASVAFLLFLNLDKFCSLWQPLKYPYLITKRLVVTITLCTWTILFAFTIYMYWSPFMKRHNNTLSCVYAVTPSKIFYAIYTLVSYVVPVLISLLISVYIFWIATFSGRHLGGSRHQKRRKQLWLRILFVFSSTLWSCLTFLPYRVGFARYLFCVFQREETHALSDVVAHCMPPSHHIAMTVFLYTLSLGAVGNPIITIVTQRTYCMALSKYLPFLRLYSAAERNLSIVPSRRTSVFTSLLTAVSSNVERGSEIEMNGLLRPSPGTTKKKVSICEESENEV